MADEVISPFQDSSRQNSNRTHVDGFEQYCNHKAELLQHKFSYINYNYILKEV